MSLMIIGNVIDDDVSDNTADNIKSLLRVATSTDRFERNLPESDNFQILTDQTDNVLISLTQFHCSIICLRHPILSRPIQCMSI